MRVPRPKSGCDIKSLPLSPAEAFLLSRIDATANERDLSMTTGMSPADVAAALDRLEQLGAIERGAPPAPPAPRASVSGSHARVVPPPAPSQARVVPPPAPSQARVVPPPAPSQARAVPPPAPSQDRVAPPVARVAPEAASGSAPLLYDPAELDEVVEIDDEKKRRILDLFYRLEDLTYYQVLGVEAQAEKKRIKSAYYALAPEFHPDKFFRKNLGSYKAKIEAVFNRFTIAHDVLTAKDRRAEYDEYLVQTQKNRVMAAIIEQTPRDVARVQAAVDVAAGAPVTDHASSPGRYASEPAPLPPAPEPSVVSARPVAEPPPVSSEDAAKSRRATLARKLSGTMRRPTPTSSTSSSPSPSQSPESLQRTAEALRVRHDVSVAAARRAQLQSHLDQGKLALDQQQFAAAANAYRIAASLAPDDQAVQATCAEAVRLADAALADGYWRQALYEESQDRWAEAALSYSKVCNGRPTSAKAHERVAVATLKSSANIRRAVDFARRAVELEPKSAQFRLTLASAYMAAGLERSALGEIERALELAPGDQKIKDLSQQVRVQAQKPGN
jgi:tetratricopeptide (TPR) repeat protein